MVADWIQSDALSGTDPAQPVVVEVNADPGGRGGREWVPSPSSRSRATGARWPGRTSRGSPTAATWCGREPATGPATRPSGARDGPADHTPPVVTDVRVAGQPSGPTGIAEIAYTAIDPSPGVGLAGGAAAAVGPGGERGGLDLTRRIARARGGAAARGWACTP